MIKVMQVAACFEQSATSLYAKHGVPTFGCLAGTCYNWCVPFNRWQTVWPTCLAYKQAGACLEKACFYVCSTNAKQTTKSVTVIT